MLTKRKATLLLLTLVIGVLGVWFIATRSGNDDPGLKASRSMASVERIVVASEQYFVAHGKWPSGLASLLADERWSGLSTNDAWGHPLKFVPYDPARKCGVVITLGADNKPGGEGLDADGFGCFGGNGHIPPMAELHRLSSSLSGLINQ